MKWIGKIIGAILGYLIAGPFGLIIGVLIGQLFDQGGFQRWRDFFQYARAHQQVQGTFFNATFLVMGNIAKADGRVSENEILIARRIMQQMGLNEQLKQEAMRLFTEGKQAIFNLDATLANLRKACLFQPSLLQIFLEIQMQMAYADGQYLSPQKQGLLKYICQQLGIEDVQLNQFEARYRAEQTYQHYYQRPSQDPNRYLNEAYQILGVPKTIEDAEVKRAYRRLMSQHHPDKLIAKGLPPEMIKLATEKTQQIKKAYEQICQARGMA